MYLFQVLLNQEKGEDWRFEEILLQGHVVSVSGLVELGKGHDWRFEEILLQDHVVSVSGLVEPGEGRGLEV